MFNSLNPIQEASLPSAPRGANLPPQLSNAMKLPKPYRAQPFASEPTLHTLLLPRLPEEVRRFLKATYAARGGAEHMTLREWREVEQELTRRLEYEHNECQ